MISIIIPVFNGENFILNCYQSLLNQTDKNWEAVFIDDGSYDNSYSIISKISESDSRIKLIRQQNSGQVKARVEGIKNSKGDYCLFLDIDDTLIPTAIAKINSVINEHEPDIVMFNGVKIDRNGEKLKFWDHIDNSEVFYKGEDYIKLRNLVFKNRRLNNICFKAYKRRNLQLEEIKDDCFKTRTEEDLIMQLPFLDNSKNLYYIPNDLYLYNYNPSSVTNTYNPNLLEDAIRLNKALMFYGQKWEVDSYKSEATYRLNSTFVASVVYDAHNLDFRSFKKKMRRIQGSSIYSDLINIPNNVKIPKSRQAVLSLLKYHQFYCLYLISRNKVITN